MHRSLRPGGARARYIVLHTDEGGNENYDTAAGLAEFIAHEEGGYHETADSRSCVVCANDNELVYGAAGGNTYGWHICLCGHAGQSRAEWLDAYSTGELHLVAQRVAAACKRMGITAQHLSDAQLGANWSGIVDHGAITRVFKARGADGHWDVGPNFPWDVFMPLVMLALAPPAKPIDWKALAAIDKWHGRIKKKDLRYGDRGPDVATLNKLLALKGFLPKRAKGDRYGLRTWSAVHTLKLRHHWRKGTATGRVFGPFAADALLK